MFASFPISDYVCSDTIVIDGSKYIEVGVDSLYKFPLPDEDLNEYRARLKKYNIQKSIKTPITFWQVILMLALIFLIGFIITVASVTSEIQGNLN